MLLSGVLDDSAHIQFSKYINNAFVDLAELDISDAAQKLDTNRDAASGKDRLRFPWVFLLTVAVVALVGLIIKGARRAR